MSNHSGHAYLKQAINNLDALPAMPVIAKRLLNLKLDTEEGERILLALIEQDPQISAKILGLANSVTGGASHQIKTMKDATKLLGIKRIKSVASSVAAMSLMPRPPAGKFNMQDLWLHSIGIASAMLGLARVMPEKMRPQDDQIFLLGMLHVIGYVAMLFIDPQRCDKLFTRLSAETNRPSLEVERDTLGMSHDELGAELARHWNLPEEIITVLRYHHTPDTDEAEAGQPLIRMLNIVEKLLPTFGKVDYMAPDISAKEWEALGIDPSKAKEVTVQIEELADQAIQYASSFT
jgi:HD-like signal output (HDOD) protein